MSKRFIVLFALASLSSCSPGQPEEEVTAQQTQAVWSEPDPAYWTKVFDDGFNLPHTFSADGKSYIVNGQTLWTNLGSGTVTFCGLVDTAQPGLLKLYARPRVGTEYQCRLTSNQAFGAGADSGATYIFASRVKVHTSGKHLSSFWVKGQLGNDVNEIDVIENTGQKTQAGNCANADHPNVLVNQSGYWGLNHTFYSAYSPRTGYKHCLSQASANALLDNTFHVFSAEWSPGQYVKFFIDGNLSATYGPEYAKTIPVNLILTNIDHGVLNQTGSVNYFEVDWVRAWQKNGSATEIPTEPPTVPFGWDWAGMGSNHELAQGDFDGDGKMDKVIVDRSTGWWHFYYTTVTGVPTPQSWQWGGMDGSYKLALGDYDGDGKTDKVIVQPSTGWWRFFYSTSPGAVQSWQWPGMTSAHEVASGDYDGDGKTDKAIVNRSAGTWHIIYSSTWPAVQTADNFTWAGMNSSHELALGDYDGDGKTDKTIVQRSTGLWWTLPSNGSASSFWEWAWAGMDSSYELALGDYDGDGKTDRTIVQRATGLWWTLPSGGGTSPFWEWDWAGMDSSHELAIGDYNGDGKTDRAIVQRSTGKWWAIASP